MFALLGFLLRQPRGRPLRSFYVAGNRVVVDGEAACSSDEFRLALEGICESAGLAEGECEYLFRPARDGRVED